MTTRKKVTWQKSEYEKQLHQTILTYFRHTWLDAPEMGYIPLGPNINHRPLWKQIGIKRYVFDAAITELVEVGEIQIETDRVLGLIARRVEQATCADSAVTQNEAVDDSPRT